MSHDIIIVGGGPAGLSAAITARARNKRVLVVSNPLDKNPLAASKRVVNYPGLPAASGLQILEEMSKQAMALGAEALQARVLSILPSQDGFDVATSSDSLQSRTVIICCGQASGGKPYKGEAEYLGRGVSYCATCDGMLYKQATVLIAGHTDEAVAEANFMAEIGATVHYLASKLPENLEPHIIRHSGKLLAIEGDALGVTHAVISEQPRARSASSQNRSELELELELELEQAKLDVNAVFILRPGIAPANLLMGLELENGFIKVDARMHTNVKGVFAAGDCTGQPMQIAKAVGEGQLAVLSAVDYLLTHDS